MIFSVSRPSPCTFPRSISISGCLAINSISTLIRRLFSMWCIRWSIILCIIHPFLILLGGRWPINHLEFVRVYLWYNSVLICIFSVVKQLQGIVIMFGWIHVPSLLRTGFRLFGIALDMLIFIVDHLISIVPKRQLLLILLSGCGSLLLFIKRIQCVYHSRFSICLHPLDFLLFITKSNNWSIGLPVSIFNIV